jgi:hypothetical protein
MTATEQLMSDHVVPGFPRDVVAEAARNLIDISTDFYASANPSDWMGNSVEQVAHIHAVTDALIILLRTEQTAFMPLSLVVISVMGEMKRLPQPLRQLAEGANV